MQLVHVTLSTLQRRNRVAFALTPLEVATPTVGEHVVVRDQGGRYFAALVVASAYDEPSGRSAHQLRLGVALSEDLAQRRLDRPELLVAGDLHDQLEAYLTEAAAFHAAMH